MENKDSANPFSPTPLQSIKEQVGLYHQMMKELAIFLKNTTNTSFKKPIIDPDTQYLQFYIDKAALANINAISETTGVDCIGVFFGLDPKKDNKVTACFLGLDKNKEIFSNHFEKKIDAQGNPTAIDALQGEEDWPPPPKTKADFDLRGKRPYFTVASEIKDVQNYFMKPTPVK